MDAVGTIIGVVLSLLTGAFIMVKYIIVKMHIPGRSFWEVDARI